MTATFTFGFYFGSEIATVVQVAPFICTITGEVIGNFAGAKGAVNPDHYLETGIDLADRECIIFINCGATAAGVQAGVVRDSSEDGRLVMTEPASGDIQRWDLAPRTTINLDDFGGVDAPGIGFPEGVLPWGMVQNAWLSAPCADILQSVQCNNPTGTATAVVFGMRAGTVKVHLQDPNA